MQYLLLFKGNSGYANASQSYVYTCIAAFVFVRDVNYNWWNWMLFVTQCHMWNCHCLFSVFTTVQNKRRYVPTIYYYIKFWNSTAVFLNVSFSQPRIRKDLGRQSKETSYNLSFWKSMEKLITYVFETKYEGWNFNSGNYLFTTDTK